MKKILGFTLFVAAALWPLACGKNLAPTAAGPVTVAQAPPAGSPTPTATLAPEVGSAWFKVTSAAPFPGRGGQSACVFNNRMWVIGGGSNATSGLLNDSWSTLDGVDWISATTNAAFTPRIFHASAVFNTRLWVSGGSTAGLSSIGVVPPLADLWYSYDGAAWIQAAVTAAFGAREGHSLVAFNNLFWMIAGSTNDVSGFSDVWSSPDGVTWNQVTAEAPFLGRTAQSALVYNNRMWVIGGNDTRPRDGGGLNDVWYSPDGVNWTEATAHAAFSPRAGHASLVYDNQMWVIGGVNLSGNPLSDAWYSSDGVHWTQATPSAGFGTRGFLSSLSFNGEMWVLCGLNGSSVLDDIWQSP